MGFDERAEVALLGAGAGAREDAAGVDAEGRHRGDVGGLGDVVEIVDVDLDEVAGVGEGGREALVVGVDLLAGLAPRRGEIDDEDARPVRRRFDARLPVRRRPALEGRMRARRVQGRMSAGGTRAT